MTQSDESPTESKAAHTPGRWQARPRDAGMRGGAPGGWTIRADGHPQIAYLQSHPNRPPEENAANAALIAAAPETRRQRDMLKAAAIKAHLYLCDEEAVDSAADTDDVRLTLAHAIAECKDPSDA